MRQRLPSTLLPALVACLASTPAGARELWATEDGASSLEVRAFYKTLGTALRMQPGLVESTRSLEALLSAAREGLPAEQADLLPAASALPSDGLTSAHVARLWGRLLLRERLELQAGWQLGTLVVSDRALSGGAPLGGVPTSSTQGASRRLADFDPVLASGESVQLQHNLDLLAVKVRAPFADLIAGRQVLSWGSGRLWNPTDLLSPFGPADLDREVRRGVDAVRLSVPLAAAAQLELLWLPQPDARDHGGVARAQFNVKGFDLAPSMAKYVRDVVLGLDATGDIGPVGVHGELAWTSALDRDESGRRDRFARAVAGLDVRPTDKLILTGEYYFNGWGASDPAGYVQVMSSPRATRGEVFGAGRHYLGLVAAYQATELLSLQSIGIANLTDPSVLVVPALEYWAEQSVLVRLGGYLPLGRRPDASALRALTPEDVRLGSDAAREALGSLGLRSEYGASPFGVFAQVAIYLL